MATAEDRAHAEALRHDYQRRLRVRERQLSRLGDAADPSVEIDIEQLRLNIATLNEALDAKPDDAAQEAADRLIEDNNRFLFVQAVKTNQRLAKVEERVDTIATTQHAASLERIDTRAAIEDLNADKAEGERGRRRNFYLFLLVIILLLLIGGAVFALSVRVLG